jgi:hypothetical protein
MVKEWSFEGHLNIKQGNSSDSDFPYIKPAILSNSFIADKVKETK